MYEGVSDSLHIPFKCHKMCGNVKIYKKRNQTKVSKPIDMIEFLSRHCSKNKQLTITVLKFYFLFFHLRRKRRGPL
jgi:hypothetical protein